MWTHEEIEAHEGMMPGRERSDWLWSALAAVALVAWLVWDWRGHLPVGSATPFTFPVLLQPALGRVNDSECYANAQTFLILENIGALEHRQEGGFRHALGPATSIVLWSERPIAVVSFNLHNGIPGQGMEVLYNGVTLEKMENLPERTQVERSYQLAVQADSENRLTLRFSLSLHHGVEPPGEDPRDIAATFDGLGVSLP